MFEKKLSLVRQMSRLQLVILILGFANCKAAQPNIIFILADDVGWNDVSFHGSKQIPTPNIDSLASDGVILNNYYYNALCTPSRGSLMTGKDATRLGLQHLVILADEPWGLPLEEKVLPQYLKDLGYSTRGVGKWHLGFYKREYLPTSRGFDSFFGIWTDKTDYYTHVHKMYDRNVSGCDFHDNEDAAGSEYDGQYATDIHSKKAADIIRTHNYTQPLFLYLSHQAAHTGNDYDPLQVPDRYLQPFQDIKDEERKKYAGIVSSLDFSVGEIYSAMHDAEILDNTIIVFSSDNGGAVKGFRHCTASNYPLRGSKATLWEGGTRGVSWIWSSELRKESRVHDGLMHISDWLPTLYAAAGGTVDKLGDLDGYNQWPTISQRQPTPRQDFLYNFDPGNNNYAAVRKNQFKLISGTIANGNFDGWFDKEGNNISQSNIKTYFANNHESLIENKDYSNLFKKSRASSILAKNFGVHSLRRFSIEEETKLQVNCQREEQSVKEPCKPTEKPCLFDLEKDPCEFNNLADRMPEVVEELTNLLDSYKKKSVLPRNALSDPAANPKFHNNAFVPWQSKPWISDSSTN